MRQLPALIAVKHQCAHVVALSGVDCAWFTAIVLLPQSIIVVVQAARTSLRSLARLLDSPDIGPDASLSAASARQGQRTSAPVADRNKGPATAPLSAKWTPTSVPGGQYDQVMNTVVCAVLKHVQEVTGAVFSFKDLLWSVLPCTHNIWTSWSTKQTISKVFVTAPLRVAFMSELLSLCCTIGYLPMHRCPINAEGFDENSRPCTIWAQSGLVSAGETDENAAYSWLGPEHDRVAEVRYCMSQWSRHSGSRVKVGIDMSPEGDLLGCLRGALMNIGLPEASQHAATLDNVLVVKLSIQGLCAVLPPAVMSYVASLELSPSLGDVQPKDKDGGVKLDSAGGGHRIKKVAGFVDPDKEQKAKQGADDNEGDDGVKTDVSQSTSARSGGRRGRSRGRGLKRDKHDSDDSIHDTTTPSSVRDTSRHNTRSAAKACEPESPGVSPPLSGVGPGLVVWPGGFVCGVHIDRPYRASPLLTQVLCLLALHVLLLVRNSRRCMCRHTDPEAPATYEMGGMRYCQERPVARTSSP